MAKYKIEVAQSAEKALNKLPKADLVRVMEGMQNLVTNPFPIGCRKLNGEEDTYRIRIGNYRIIYEVYKKLVLIKVLKVGHRKEVYR